MNWDLFIEILSPKSLIQEPISARQTKLSERCDDKDSASSFVTNFFVSSLRSTKGYTSEIPKPKASSENAKCMCILHNPDSGKTYLLNTHYATIQVLLFWGAKKRHLPSAQLSWITAVVVKRHIKVSPASPGRIFMHGSQGPLICNMRLTSCIGRAKVRTIFNPPVKYCCQICKQLDDNVVI